MLTTKQAAKIIGVTQRRINALIKSGRLTAQRFGRMWMIKKSDAKNFKRWKPGQHEEK